MGRLEGKVAIVTGAGSGIGAATARRFVAEGARVVVADRDGAAAERVAAELTRAPVASTADDASGAGRAAGTATDASVGAAAVASTTDVTDPEAVAAMVATAVERFGRLDVLYSNAGVPEQVKPLAEIGIEEWDRVIAVNLTAFFHCAQAAAPVMRAAGGGALIVTASVAADRPRPGMAAYVASKTGVIGLAKALAVELAADRIRVNVINPGPALTPMLAQFGFSQDPEAAAAELAAALPLGQAIEPHDIAAAAVYLASDEAAKVTGAVLNVDSGRGL